MNKGRLFTFGCSITRYYYPTWADILGQTWEYFENWAQPGSGNNFIFNSVIECDQRNKFNSNDTVLILWSGVSRIDYYQYGQWRKLTNKFPGKDKDSIVHCPNGYEIVSYALITALHQYLDSKKVNYRSMTWHDYDLNTAAGQVYSQGLSKLEDFKIQFNNLKYSHNNIDKFILRFEKLYTDLAGPDWPTLESIALKNYNTTDEIQLEINDFVSRVANDKEFVQSNKDTIDQHPLPSQHLAAVRNKFGNIIPDTIANWISEIEKQVLAGQPVVFDPNQPKIRL